jgi:uncharacterized protein YyaL (SSP411 family)
MSFTWHDWCRESFEQAAEEGRPIFLFLGAFWDPATRMVEEKIFSLPEISALVNDDYLPIRVDLDQRPDIYDRYSTEGWPSMSILTPQGAPIWVSNSFGEEELRKILSQLKGAYQAGREVVDREIRERNAKNGKERRRIYHMKCRVNDEIFRKTVRGVMASFDLDHMGFGGEPKYPHPSSLQVLAHAYSCVGAPDLQENLAGGLKPLEALFDGNSGGFHRFARKKDWTQPLTAKMCEENAELVRVCLDGFKLLGEPVLRDFADRTVSWALFTLWNGSVARFSGSQAATELGDPPPVDPAQFTSGSAAMASALFQASVDLDRDDCAAIAFQCVDALWAEGFDPEKGMAAIFNPGPLYHGQARSQALMLGALLDAYEHSGKEVYLERTGHLLAFCRDRLWSDEERGILDRLPGEDVLGELKEPRKNLHENALVAEAAVRWGELTGKEDREFPGMILESFPNFMDDYSHHTTRYALAADAWARPALRIDLHDPTVEWRRAALLPFLPRKVVRTHVGGEKPRAVVRRGEDFEQSVHSPEELAGLLSGL